MTAQISGNVSVGWLGTALALALAACAEPPDDWIGHTAAELRHVWGQPTEETESAGGRTVTYLSYWNPGLHRTNTCRQAFSINGKDIITLHSMLDCSR